MVHWTVRCATGQCTVHQGHTLRTSHSREFQGALCYNSPDCPMSQRSNGYLGQRSTLQSVKVGYSVAAEVSAVKSEGTGLSGVAPDYLMPQEDKAPTVDPAPNPNGWVTWRRTGQGIVPVRCAHRQQPPQRLWKWLKAINTPQPPHSYQSKHSKHFIQFKNKRLHSKTHQID